MKIWRIAIVAGALSCLLVLALFLYEGVTGAGREASTKEYLSMGAALGLLFLLVVAMVSFTYYFFKSFYWFAWPAQYMLTGSTKTTHLDVKDLFGLVVSSIICVLTVIAGTGIEKLT